MSQPVHTLTSAEFVGDVTGAMQMAAEGNTVLITDGGEPAWVLLDIDMCRRLITGVTELSSGDARPHRPLDDYLRIIRQSDRKTAQHECANVSIETVIALAHRIDLPFERLRDGLGLPAESLTLANLVRPLNGSARRAVIGVVQLLVMVEDIADQSTSSDAKQFDAGKWLGEWLQRPQPALGGSQPIELLKSSTRIAAVTRVLGAIESGSFL